MSPEVEALLEQVAARDPEKARYLRWVHPQLKDEGLIAAARTFLATPAVRGAAGPKETLLEVDMALDPDCPTGLFEIGTNEAADFPDDPTSPGT